MNDEPQKSNVNNKLNSIWMAVQKFLLQKNVLEKEEKILEEEAREITTDLQKKKVKKYIDNINT